MSKNSKKIKEYFRLVWLKGLKFKVIISKIFLLEDHPVLQ